MSTPLEIVSNITEFNSISKYMQDDDLDEALATVVKLIMKPDVPPAAASVLIVKLQALSAKFAMLKRYYMTYEKGVDASVKKNTYASAEDAINGVVAALKYSVRGL